MKLKKAGCFIMAAVMAVMCSCSDKAVEQKVTQYQTKTQFHYGDGFVLPRDTQMGIYEFTQYGGENKIDALSAVFFSADEKLSAAKEEVLYSSPAQKLETQDGSKILVLSDNGRFLYHDFDREPKLDAFPGRDIIFAESFESTYVKFDKYSGAYLNELSDKAEAYITECLMALGADITLRPDFAILNTMSVSEEPDDPTVPEVDYYFADIFFTLDLDDGLATVKPSRSDSYTPYTLKEFYKTDEINFSISASMYDTEKPFEVESIYELILPAGLTDKKSHLDCDEAIVHTYNKYFMNAKNMTLTHAELEYHPYVESYDNTLWSQSFVHQTGAVYTAEPYWALYFECPEINIKLCVNALNGKIKTVEQPKSLLTFDGRKEVREPLYNIQRGYELVIPDEILYADNDEEEEEQ